MNTKQRINNKQINIEAYKVRLGIRSERKYFLSKILGRLGEIIPTGFNFIGENDVEHLLEIKENEGGMYQVWKKDELLCSGKIKKDFIDLIESQIRLTIAEFADEKVFLHAGVVGWKGQALIFPASSFSGKTTLVSELIKNGAIYYSDEYAVLDKDGFVHPFPKKLSLRGIIDDYKQFDLSAESFGATVGQKPIPVGMVLLAKFEKNVEKQENLKMQIISSGQGMIEILAHAISIRQNPKFVLNVLNKISTRAIIAKTQRGEAKLFARHLLKHLNKRFLSNP